MHGVRMYEEPKPKSIFFNMMINAILTVLNIIFPLITFPYAARVLMPEGIGKVNFAVSVVAYFGMFAQLGISTYGVRESAKVRNDREKLSKVVNELVTINITSALIVYFVFLISLLIVPRFSIDKTLFFVIGVSILLNSIGVEWLYQGLEKYGYITLRSAAFKLVSIIAMFIFVKAPSDYIIYGAVTVFASSASNILNFVNLRKYVDLKPFDRQCYKKRLPTIMVFFAMSAATTVYTNLDNVMLGFIKGNTEVGYYSTAVKVKTVLVSLITSFSAVLLPRTSFFIDSGKFDEFLEMIKKAVKTVLMISIPAAIFFMVFAKESVLILSGNLYLDSVPSMIAIMPTLVFIGVTNVLGIQMMVPMGKERIVLNSVLIGALIDLLINLLMIPKYGALGAATGTLVAEFVVLLYQLLLVSKMSIKVFDIKNILNYTICSIIALLCALFISHFFASHILIIIFSGSIFLIVYSFTLYIAKDDFFMELFHRFSLFMTDFENQIKNKLSNLIMLNGGRTKENILIISYCIYTTALIVFGYNSLYNDLNGIPTLYRGMCLLAYALVVVKLCWDAWDGSFTFGRCLLIALITALLIPSAYFSGNKNPLIYWFFIAAAHNVDFKRIIRCALLTHVICLAFVVLSSYIGIVDNKIIDQSSRVRECLGFTYTTEGAHHFFYITLMAIYILKDRIRWPHIVLLVAGTIYFYITTDTKNPFFMGLLIIFAAVLLKYIKYLREYKKYYTILGVLAVPICAAFILYATYNFVDTGFYSVFNKLITGRLRLGKDALERYPINLFGQPIPWFGDAELGIPYVWVDSSYINMLMTFGCIFFLLIILGTTVYVLAMGKRKDTYLLLVFGFISIYSSFDTQFLDIKFNSFLMAYSYIAGSHLFNWISYPAFLNYRICVRDIYFKIREILEKYVKLYEPVYLITFVIYFSYEFLGTTMINRDFLVPIYRLMIIVDMMLIAYRYALFDINKWKKYLLMSIILMATGLYWLKNGLKLTFIIGVMISAAFGCSFKKIGWTAFITGISIMLLSLLLSVTGVIENLIYLKDGVNTYTLGIGYTTDCSAHWFFLLALFAVLRGNKLNNLELILMLAVDIAIYFITRARTGFICLSLLILMIIALRFISKVNGEKIVVNLSGILTSAFIILPLLTVVFTTLYDPEVSLYNVLGGTVAARFRMGKEAIDQYGISALGTIIEQTGMGGGLRGGERYFFLDSSYIELLLERGVIIFLIVCFIMLGISFRAFRNKNMILLIALSLIALSSVMEHHLFDISYNIFLLLALANWDFDKIEKCE